MLPWPPNSPDPFLVPNSRVHSLAGQICFGGRKGTYTILGRCFNVMADQCNACVIKHVHPLDIKHLTMISKLGKMYVLLVSFSTSLNDSTQNIISVDSV